MLKLLLMVYQRLLMFLAMPLILGRYLAPSTGRDYRVGFRTKFLLLLKMVRNDRAIVGATNFVEILTMAARILSVPPALEGCMVECGCYKGRSTANLSLICEISGRTLEVFDSFEGLPEPRRDDKAHTLLDLREIHTYSKGAWLGSLDEVKRNVSRYGAVKFCNFNPGYFKDTLPRFDKKCVFVFLDVDLKGSLEACVRYLWPGLQDGCHVFTHEAAHLEVVSLFHDREWWHTNLNCNPPGLVGAGSGLGL